MSLGKALLGALAVGSGMLVYGGLVEARRLRREHHVLRLPRWPASHYGYRIGFLADLHLDKPDHCRMAREASEWLAEQGPDVVVLGGDVVHYAEPHRADAVAEALAPLVRFKGRAFGVWGNHDRCHGEPDFLLPVLERCGIRVLVNELTVHDGINWIGVDTAIYGRSDPYSPILDSDPSLPTVVVWHECDMADHLPRGPELMLAGHSHGGQFILPGGVAPMAPVYGSKYLRGYYPDLAVPLYVTRGVAATGPPSRFLCPPEVSVLTLVS